MHASSFMSLDAIVVCVSSVDMFALEKSKPPSKSSRHTMIRGGDLRGDLNMTPEEYHPEPPRSLTFDC